MPLFKDLASHRDLFFCLRFCATIIPVCAFRDNVNSGKKRKELKIKVKSDYVGLYFAPFLADMCMGSIMIAVPLFAISLGVSSLTLGTLGFTSGIAYVSLCFLFGRLSERWHRRDLVMLGSSLWIATSLLLCFSSRIYQLYLSMLLLGIGGAMFWPALEAWIAEKQSRISLTKRMALFCISWSAGLTIGPLAGGILFGINFKLPFYLALIISTFIFFLLWKTPGVDSSTKSEAFTHKTLFSKGARENFSLYIKLSRIANFTLAFSMGMIRYIFPKLGTQLTISPSVLGLLMFALFLSQTLTFYGLGVIHQWHYRTFPLVFFQLIAVVGLVMIFVTGSVPLYFLAFVFIGVGRGMTDFSSLFYSVNTTSQRGPSAAIHEATLGSGFLLGPLIGGAVAQRFSLKTPYLVAVAAVVGGIFIQILIKRYYGFLNRVTTR